MERGYAVLRVPAGSLPTSESLDLEEEPPAAAAGAACEGLFPDRSVTLGRNASLLPRSSLSGDGAAAAAGRCSLCSQPPAAAPVADDEAAADDTDRTSGSAQPLILRQEEIPCQPGGVLEVAAAQCTAQRVGTRPSGGAGAAERPSGTACDVSVGEPSEPAYDSDDFEAAEAGEGSAPGAAGAPAPGSAGTSCAASRVGQRAGSAYAGDTLARPASAPSHTGPRARPRLERPALEDRIAAQLARHPAHWSAYEVCDWLEYIGLGQYRKRMIHHCITGELLLRLTSEQLKVDIGIGPLGHREGLLRAISDLQDHFNNAGMAYSEDGEGSEAGSAGSRTPSPSPGPARARPGPAADVHVMRAYEQRQRLVKELQKAEAREAHRRRLTEDALHTLQLAEAEVAKLRATIADLDRSMGWGGGQLLGLETLDMHGALPWHPAGQGLRPATSPARQPGSPQMSKVSRRIMEGTASSFMERLQTDIANRQAKRQAAPSSAAYLPGGVVAEREREARDIQYIRELVAGKSDELHALLGSGSPGQVEQALEEAAEALQGELGLHDEQVAAVKRARGAGAKAARLANAVRSVRFMARLEEDLATRDQRLRELQQQWFKLEGGRNPAEQETHDAQKAAEMFSLLGWPEGELQLKPDDASGPTDDLLAALLGRARALQRAAEQHKEVDWALFKKDGLQELQDRRCAELQAAAEQRAAAQQEEEAARQAAARAGRKQNFSAPRPAPPPLPAASNYLQEAVGLLARCRDDELAALERLGGYRKLVMTYRAVRAMRFIDFTRQDLAQRKQKTEALAQQVYPPNRKVLPKEQFASFFDRLMEDTARRMANRAEIAERARQEALAKLAGKGGSGSSSPAPCRRPASART